MRTWTVHAKRTSNDLGFDTRAGVYLDGVYIGTPPAADARIGLRSQQNRWEIALYGRNLGDQTYASATPWMP